MGKKEQPDLGYLDMFADEQDIHRIGDVIEVAVKVRIDSIKSAAKYDSKKKYVYDCSVLEVIKA